MDTIELLSKFANPDVIKSLPLMDKMIASLITTVLGMGITFLSLITLQFVIALLAKLAVEKKEKTAESHATSPAFSENTGGGTKQIEDEELVAAITTALALQLKTSVSNIVIRNIEKVEETSSAWQRAGIAEQMNNSI